MTYPDNYVLPDEEWDRLPNGKIRAWNLRYDKAREEELSRDVWTIEDDRTEDIVNPRPAVNPVMRALGDSVSMNSDNDQYVLAVKQDGSYPIDITDILKNNEETVEVQNGSLVIHKIVSDGDVSDKVIDKDDVKKD